MKYMTLWAVALISIATTAGATMQARCSVTDLEEYYGEDLDEEYKIDREALAIAEGLFEGPLMKEGRGEDVAPLRQKFVDDRDIEVQELQRLVRRHLYGSEGEFSELFARLSDRRGPEAAANRLRDSIYEAYGFVPKRRRDAKVDACLIERERAHLVVTKAIVSFMERRNLD